MKVRIEHNNLLAFTRLIEKESPLIISIAGYDDGKFWCEGEAINKEYELTK